jgi:hypothetical protein
MQVAHIIIVEQSDTNLFPVSGEGDKLQALSNQLKKPRCHPDLKPGNIETDGFRNIGRAQVNPFLYPVAVDNKGSHPSFRVPRLCL